MGKLEAEIKKMDMHYDKMNETMADGQVNGFHNDKCLGSSHFVDRDHCCRWHALAEAAIKEATYGRFPQGVFCLQGFGRGAQRPARSRSKSGRASALIIVSRHRRKAKQFYQKRAGADEGASGSKGRAKAKAKKEEEQGAEAAEGQSESKKRPKKQPKK